MYSFTSLLICIFVIFKGILFPETEKIIFFEQENIKQSIKNLREYDFIDKSINENKLNVVGLWFQINSGLIKFLDNNSFIDLD